MLQFSVNRNPVPSQERTAIHRPQCSRAFNCRIAARAATGVSYRYEGPLSSPGARFLRPSAPPLTSELEHVDQCIRQRLNGLLRCPFRVLCRGSCRLWAFLSNRAWCGQLSRSSQARQTDNQGLYARGRTNKRRHTRARESSGGLRSGNPNGFRISQHGNCRRAISRGPPRSSRKACTDGCRHRPAAT